MAMLKKSLNKKQAIKLKIPAEPGFINLARLVLSAELRRNNVDEEDIEDVKIVLSELLAKAIESHLVSDCISIEMTFNQGVMELSVLNLEEFKPQDLFNSPYLNFEVISSLVDHFDLLMPVGKQCLSIRITKRFTPLLGVDS